MKKYEMTNAPPMAYRTSNNIQQTTPSFPPPVYYRDTFGLQPINNRKFTDSITADYSDNESITTKSTIKTTMNIFHPQTTNNLMYESQFTDFTQSYQVEEILTNQVLILYAQPLLILTLIEFGCAIQLFIFAVICLFFDGSPYYINIIASVLFMFDFAVLMYFIRIKHSQLTLLISLILTAICFIISIAVFFWTTYLLYNEDRELRKDGFDFSKADLQKTNYIVKNTRIAMYSFHMVFAPIYAVCCFVIFSILYINKRAIIDGKVSNGYFFSKPTGHQTVLVPITLKQVKKLDQPDEIENTSIGVQTNEIRET